MDAFAEEERSMALLPKAGWPYEIPLLPKAGWGLPIIRLPNLNAQFPTDQEAT